MGERVVAKGISYLKQYYAKRNALLNQNAATPQTVATPKPVKPIRDQAEESDSEWEKARTIKHQQQKPAAKLGVEAKQQTDY